MCCQNFEELDWQQVPGDIIFLILSRLFFVRTGPSIADTVREGIQDTAAGSEADERGQV